jgi:hypothetical protein
MRLGAVAHDWPRQNPASVFAIHSHPRIHSRAGSPWNIPLLETSHPALRIVSSCHSVFAWWIMSYKYTTCCPHPENVYRLLDATRYCGDSCGVEILSNSTLCKVL